MKKTPIILSIIATVLSVCAIALILAGPECCSKKAVANPESAVTAAAGDIVYVRIDTLVNNYDMFSDLRAEFEAKAQSVEEDINKKGRKLESDGKAFENQINKGLLTRSAAEKQQQALLQRQQDLQNYAGQKQAEIQEEQLVLMNKVMDAIKTYLEAYNAEHHFAAILTTSEATNVVLVGDPAIDITQEVLDGLNAEYVKNRN